MNENKNWLSNQIIQIKQNNELVVLANKAFYKLEAFINSYGKVTSYFSSSGRGEEPANSRDRIVNLELYKYVKEHGYDSPKGNINEIQIKFIDDFIKDNQGFINGDSLRKLNNNGYKYILVDNEYLKGLFGFFIINTWLENPETHLTNSIETLRTDEKKIDLVALDIVQKYSCYSEEQVKELYNSALSSNDIIKVEEISIFVHMDEDYKKDISKLNDESLLNKTSDSFDNLDGSKDDDSDLPF